MIPAPFNPQSLNRLSYVHNNPVRFNDPTGHSVDCGLGELGCNAGKYTPPTSQSGNGRSGTPKGRGGNISLDASFTPPTGWEFTSIEPQNPTFEEYTWSIFSPFAIDACNNYLYGVCDFSTTVPDFTLVYPLWHPTGQRSTRTTSTLLEDYTFNAFGFGGGGIVGFFPAQTTGGAEAIYLMDDASINIYGYDGFSTTAAGGAFSAGPYAIFAFNIDEPSDYAGFSHSVNMTVAYGHGATISYFWAGETLFDPGAPQGVTVWYSPGLSLDIAYSDVSYEQWLSFRR